MNDDLVRRVIARIDAANADDPMRVTHAGREMAREQRHAERMSYWTLQLRSDASPELRIAVRGQHIRRWALPRDHFDRDRAGYLRWRETLKRFHADTVAAIMREEAASDVSIERVQALILKRNIKGDPETQTLEDALCLTFLETDFADLRAAMTPEKLEAIVAKTWSKMSESGKATAAGIMETETGENSRKNPRI